MFRFVFFLLFAGHLQAQLTDDQLLNTVAKQTFKYFWEGAEPTSGMARERLHVDGDYPHQPAHIITSGGSGFGLMSILVGMERKYVSRTEGVSRIKKITNFLLKADKYHGVWPHWWNGQTAKTEPFSQFDDGADLVESSFMAAALITTREYLKNGTKEEQQIARTCDKLWRDIDFKWFTKGEDVLYWHWSPNHGFKMNFAVRGYNECLIMYVLAASSPTHPVSTDVYHKGWAENGKIKTNKKAFDGTVLNARHQGNPENGGPLFWSHYSFLGLDPHGLKDKYLDYWAENKKQVQINYNWCIANPKGFKNYGAKNWGLTSSYSINGYDGHAPSMANDLGVISPTAAISSVPYMPKKSIAAMRNWYQNKKELWGPYGFYDAFSDTANWLKPHYLAIDQGPMVVMIENHRSQMIWKLFMNAPEIKKGLKKLGFKSPYLSINN